MGTMINETELKKSYDKYVKNRIFIGLFLMNIFQKLGKKD